MTNGASSNYINTQAVPYQVQPQLRNRDVAQVATDKSQHAVEIANNLSPGDKSLEGHKISKNIRNLLTNANSPIHYTNEYMYECIIT